MVQKAVKYECLIFKAVLTKRLLLLGGEESDLSEFHHMLEVLVCLDQNSLNL